MGDLIPKNPSDKVIEETVKAAKEFVGKLLNPTLEETGGIIGDQINFWRFKNKVNIVLKAKAFLEEKNIDPQPILPKTLIPIIENGSLEEDETLQTKWASMLANAADPDSGVEVRPSYPDILNQLSPPEVRLLDIIYDEYEQSSDEKKEALSFSKEAVMKNFKLSSEEHDLMMDNLFRLNLCQPPASHGGVRIGKYPISLRTYELFQLTALGRQLVKSCRYE